MKQKIAVLGPGSWGTALAQTLAENGHDVRIWGNVPEQIDEINTYHTNQHFLPDLTIPESIIGYKELAEAVEQDTHKRISEVLAEEIPEEKRQAIVVLSGPSHAEEVAVHDITTITAASIDQKAAAYVQELFMNDYFRIYTNNDVIGVETGAALKNIIAIGAGAIHGLGFGDDAKAAIMTRGLAEISRLGVAMGANPLTFIGLSGVGDLIVTCTSVHSRNWRAGNLLGQGHKLEEVLENMGMVVEGVATTKAAVELAQQLGVEMPITQTIYNVLYNGEDIKKAAKEIMLRDGKMENEFSLR